MAKASLITDPVNVFYQTGFKSSNAFLLQTRSKTYLFTDGRYLEKAKKIKNIETVDLKNKEIYEQIIKKHHLKIIEFEGHSLRINSLRTFKKNFPKMKWKDNKQKIENARTIKTAVELRKITVAQRLNEQIFYSIKGALKTGVSEIEIAQKIQIEIIKKNAKPSFSPIVAFGENTSNPHSEPTKRRLKKDDLIMIDMGVTIDNYASDMTRMLFTTTPTKEQEKIYTLVLSAQNQAIKTIRPGLTSGAIDRTARNIFKKDGLQEAFCHSLGHGVGLAIHELPNLSPKSSTKLKPKMVLTVEPGLYFPKKFGIRIEDLLVITDKGVRNLTKVPKNLKNCILH